jgi:hypothetical protein
MSKDNRFPLGRRCIWAGIVLGSTFLLMFLFNEHNAKGAIRAAISLLFWSLFYGLLEYLMKASKKPSKQGREDGCDSLDDCNKDEFGRKRFEQKDERRQ